VHTHRTGLGVIVKVLEPPTDAQALLRKAAFQLLLARGDAIDLDSLQAHTGLSSESVSTMVGVLDSAGRIRRNTKGEVVGSCGLSVIPDRHEIELDGRRLWTWCAYDILGIFGALGTSGRALSPSPPHGKTIELHFTQGRPEQSEAVLFRPDEDLISSCENVYEQWCPNSNLFASRELAEQWADQQSLPGRVLELAEASELATEAWIDVV